jgi:hypothetical protein
VRSGVFFPFLCVFGDVVVNIGDTYFLQSVAGLETLEVIEGGTSLAGGDGYSPSACLPLGNNIILGKSSLDCLGGYTTAKGKAELGQGYPLNVDNLTGDVGGGSINDEL